MPTNPSSNESVRLNHEMELVERRRPGSLCRHPSRAAVAVGREDSAEVAHAGSIVQWWALNDRGKGRLVYSTDIGRVCPGCGWPVRDCKCSSRAASEPLPSRPGKIVAKLRMEKKGRGGKTVTVVAGLPRNAAFLRELCQELKRACVWPSVV